MQIKYWYNLKNDSSLLNCYLSCAYFARENCETFESPNRNRESSFKITNNPEKVYLDRILALNVDRGVIESSRSFTSMCTKLYSFDAMPSEGSFRRESFLNLNLVIAKNRELCAKPFSSLHRDRRYLRALCHRDWSSLHISLKNSNLLSFSLQWRQTSIPRTFNDLFVGSKFAFLNKAPAQSQVITQKVCLQNIYSQRKLSPKVYWPKLIFECLLQVRLARTQTFV